VSYRLVKAVRGYPLRSAGEYTASTFETLDAALAALGEHVEASGYAGTFNPRYPAATEYEFIARSTKDSSLAVVKPYEN
jgi:hypothetical protein